MKDQAKTKEQLIDELVIARRNMTTMRQSILELHRRIAELETFVKQHEKTEERLRLREEHFRQVVSSISDHIYVTEVTDDGRLINSYFSPRMEALTGYSPEEMLSDWSFWSAGIIHPDDRIATAAQVMRLTAGQNSVVEYRLVRADDQIIWIRDSASVQSSSTAKIIYGVVSDITERKTKEIALAKLLEVSRALVTTYDPARVLEKAIRSVVDIVPVTDRCSLQLLDEAGETLRTAVTSVFGEVLENPLVFRPGIGIAGHALVHNQTINVPDVFIDDRFIVGNTPPCFCSLLVAPLVVKGNLLGTLSLTSEQVDAFSVDHEALTQLMADQIAAALENARLFTNHLQAKDALRESEKRYRRFRR